MFPKPFLNLQRTEERKVAIAVRAHPTIELLEDRLYVVTCGRAGFQVFYSIFIIYMPAIAPKRVKYY